jgi:2-polyprenyl-3-methyl-5-hydroxy-6-metoxy-1,4-benzoquinol methylase
MWQNFLKQTFLKFGLIDDPFTKYVQIKLVVSENPKILDIGCGNHSPSKIKRLLPNCIYTGIDIQEYNIDEFDKESADYLHILNCNPIDFALEADKLLPDNEYDLIVMRHVIEHLSNPFDLLELACKKMKSHSLLYLSFPSEESIFFPSAKGTLNFYDDPTHIWIPSIREICNFLTNNDAKPILLNKKNRGGLLYPFIGILQLPLKLIQKKINGNFTVDFSIWALYGFESIIVARKT